MSQAKTLDVDGGVEPGQVRKLGDFPMGFSRGIANRNELGLATTLAETTLGHDVILWHGDIMVKTVDTPLKPGKWGTHTHRELLLKGVVGDTKRDSSHSLA